MRSPNCICIEVWNQAYSLILQTIVVLTVLYQRIRVASIVRVESKLYIFPQKRSKNYCSKQDSLNSKNIALVHPPNESHFGY